MLLRMWDEYMGNTGMFEFLCKEAGVCYNLTLEKYGITGFGKPESAVKKGLLVTQVPEQVSKVKRKRHDLALSFNGVRLLSSIVEHITLLLLSLCCDLAARVVEAQYLPD